MITWSFHVSRQHLSEKFTPKDGQILQLNETDIIRVEVSIPIDAKEYGEAYLLIGDVPVEMICESITDNKLVLISVSDPNIQRNQHFYNYFGESEISLCFRDNAEVAYHITVDIKARPANAQLASSMLKYISDNMNDMLMLCFSKSFIGGDFNDDQKGTMQKISLLQKIMSYMISNKGIFIRDHKFDWKNNVEITVNGSPTGPDSVFWMLQNLDRIEPSDKQSANLKINERLYKSDRSPREYISENPDVYENRVIYSFLNAAKFFVTNLIKKSFENLTEENGKYLVTDNSESYVSFEHALKNYRKSIISHHISELRQLTKSIDSFIHLYKKVLGIKLINGLPPRMTPYVLSRPSYRNLFEQVHKWYLAGTPNLAKEQLLMGLRNLSSIYELVSLHMIHSTIKKEFNIELKEKSYRYYDDYLPFKGDEKNRPDDLPYNYFFYEIGALSIELFFEPRIYIYRDNVTQIGDLINVSNKSSTFGKHYYLPDFIVRFNHDDWTESLVNVLDSKYTDQRNILRYALPDTEGKYLHEIFQVKDGGKLKSSPIKSLLLLYAHGSNAIASKLNRRHRVDGDMPVYPQGAGLKLTPNDNIHLGNWLKNIYDDHNDDHTD
tara:strand:+ start:3692 stop:5518 length:1827 start_codon:yes stop_codon:yes gene_type:complete